MPLYFFDIDDGERLTVDDTGVTFSSQTEARIAAARSLPRVIRDGLAQDWQRTAAEGYQRNASVRVRDAGGRFVFQATMKFDALVLDGKAGQTQR